MKLTRLEQVQSCVGKLPAPRDLKVMDHLDRHAIRWLSYSRFGFIAFSTPAGLNMTAVGAQAEWVTVEDANHLALPRELLDEPDIVRAGTSFGSLFLIHGMEESLRINGRVESVSSDRVLLSVEECYLHCAKAFKRSGFWQPVAIETSTFDSADILSMGSFLALATVNAAGQVDVSPKGDPAGLLIQQEGDALLIGERPGNRRIDSFRNILECPQVSVCLLVPGYFGCLKIEADASLYDGKALLERFSVQGKVPTLVLRLLPSSVALQNSDAIARADLWSGQKPPTDIHAAEIFKAHIKHSKESSLSAKLARAAVSLPGAFEKGLESDYKNKLY